MKKLVYWICRYEQKFDFYTRFYGCLTQSNWNAAPSLKSLLLQAYKNTLSMKSRDSSSWLILLALVLIWGSSFILIKKGLEAYPSNELGALRIIITFLCLSPLAIKKLINPSTANPGLLWCRLQQILMLGRPLHRVSVPKRIYANRNLMRVTQDNPHVLEVVGHPYCC